MAAATAAAAADVELLIIDDVTAGALAIRMTVPLSNAARCHDDSTLTRVLSIEQILFSSLFFTIARLRNDL